MTNKELHFKVKDTAKQYLKVEAEMVELLIQMDLRKAYQDLGYASLFQYCVQELKFSESTLRRLSRFLEKRPRSRN